MANDDSIISQDEIEKLFSAPKEAAAPAKPPSTGSSPGHSETKAAGISAATAPPAVVKSPPSVQTPPPSGPEMATQDIEYLLSQAEKALESVNSSRLGEIPAGVSTFRFQDFAPAAPSTEVATLDLIRDVELDLKIELGRTHMYLEDVLKLRKGSVVPLDKMAGDPVDIYVNGRLIARGEVLVLNDNFCVRVAELIVGASAVA
jgi:flagellar motor switch protein FliN